MSCHKPVRVGILGATGAVGQRFVALLDQHPFFITHALGASDRSAGKLYRDACKWKLVEPMPQRVAEMVVGACDPGSFDGCDIIFSGLDSSVAGGVEDAFRSAGYAVFSNAKNHRQDPDVPLVVPLVNLEHMPLVLHQRNQGHRGFIVANANCSTTGLVVALKPLHDSYGLQQVSVTTLQAISGAGYPGVPSLDIIGNIVPFIDDEEDKLRGEPRKILGTFNTSSIELLDGVLIDATCNRVPVIDGHTLCVNVKLEKRPASVQEIVETMSNYSPYSSGKTLPSMPSQAIVVRSENDRPQPRLDCMTGKGYAIVVGRVRQNDSWDVSFTLLSHNTILGAAGSSIINAEYCVIQGMI